MESVCTKLWKEPLGEAVFVENAGTHKVVDEVLQMSYFKSQYKWVQKEMKDKHMMNAAATIMKHSVEVQVRRLKVASLEPPAMETMEVIGSQREWAKPIFEDQFCASKGNHNYVGYAPYCVAEGRVSCVG